MLGHLSAASSRLSDPIPFGHTIQPVQVVRNGQRGRPRIEIDRAWLEEALTLRNPSGVARELDGVGARSIRRRSLEYGLRSPGDPVYTIIEDLDGNQIRYYTPQNPSQRTSNLSQEQLDAMLVDILISFPEFGRNMAEGDFRAQGYHISRSELRESYQRVQGGPAILGRRRIRRREYHVAGPNSLWHHDGQHGKFISMLRLQYVLPDQ